MDVDNTTCPGPFDACGDSQESFPSSFFDEGRPLHSWEGSKTFEETATRPYEPQPNAWLKAYPKERPQTSESSQAKQEGESHGRLFQRRAIVPHYEKANALIAGGIPRYIGYGMRMFEHQPRIVRDMQKRQELQRAMVAKIEPEKSGAPFANRYKMPSNFQPTKTKTMTGGARPWFNIDKMKRREAMKGKDTNSRREKTQGTGMRQCTWSVNWPTPRTKTVSK
jgi:hypothetical protein